MRFLRHAIFVLMFALAFIPGAVVLAQGSGQNDIPRLDNPLGNNHNDLGAEIILIVQEVVKVGFYVIIFFIVYSGFLFVTARGNETKLKDAKKAFLYTVVGAAILLGATIFAEVIKGTVNELKTDSRITTYLS